MEKLKIDEKGLSENISKLEKYFKEIDDIAKWWWFWGEEWIKKYKECKYNFFLKIQELLKDSDLKKFFCIEYDMSIFENKNYEKINLTLMSKIIKTLKIYLKRKNYAKKELKNKKKNTSNEIKKTFKKNNFDRGTLSEIINTWYDINEDTFDNVFETLKNYKTTRLENIYKKIKKNKSKIKKNDLDLVSTVDITLEKIKEMIDERKERNEKAEIEKKLQEKLKNEKNFLINVLKKNIWYLEDFIDWVLKNIESTKKLDNFDLFKDNFCIKYDNATEEILKSLNNYKFKTYSEAGKIKHEIESISKIYKTMDINRFIIAIKNDFLLWDIYEMIVNIEKNVGIKIPKKLNKHIKSYKEKSKLKL